MSMVMMKQIVFGTLIGVAALGAGRADAGQPVPPAPAVAPVPRAPQVPPRPAVPPATPAMVWPDVPFMPPMPALLPLLEMPPLPDLALIPAIAQDALANLAAMPPMPDLALIPTIAAEAYAALASMPPMPDLALMPTIAAEAYAALASMPPMPMPAIAPMAFHASTDFQPMFARGSFGREDRADELYREGREAINEGRYDRAIQRFDQLANMAVSRSDAALYWKAYSFNKLGQRNEALAALADLEKRFAKSAWLKDAKALEMEVRQASGQAVSPETQNDEELKLLALRGLMQSDPERALPMIEKLLGGNSSIKVKENALFVLSQSRSARAREIIAGVAKGGVNPDLQLRAIRYLGAMGGTENRQILDDAYRSTPDPAVKRAIIRSFMTSNERTKLLGLAKTEKDDALRAEAIQQLGNMRATSELAELYQSEQSIDIRKRILQSLFVGGAADKLIELAKTEKEPELRRTAIRHLGTMRRTDASDALTSIYASDSNVDVRKAIVNALFVQNNAKALVTLARAEKNLDMKKDIVVKLTNMKSDEARDYLLELLK